MTDYVKSTNFTSKDSLPSGNALKIVKGTEFDVEFNNIATAVATKADSAAVTSSLALKADTTTVNTALDLKAPLASPALTGTPTAPTAAVNTSTTQLATTAFVVAQIADDAPTKTGVNASGTWDISITGNAATATTATTATNAINVLGIGQAWQNVSRTSNTWYQNTTSKPIMVFAQWGTYFGDVNFNVNATTPDYTGSVNIPFADGDGDAGSFGVIVVPPTHYYTCDNWGTARELR